MVVVVVVVVVVMVMVMVVVVVVVEDNDQGGASEGVQCEMGARATQIESGPSDREGGEPNAADRDEVYACTADRVGDASDRAVVEPGRCRGAAEHERGGVQRKGYQRQSATT